MPFALFTTRAIPSRAMASEFRAAFSESFNSLDAIPKSAVPSIADCIPADEPVDWISIDTPELRAW